MKLYIVINFIYLFLENINQINMETTNRYSFVTDSLNTDEPVLAEEPKKAEIPIWFKRLSGSSSGLSNNPVRDPTWSIHKDYFIEGKETKLILNELYDATKMTHDQLNKAAKELLIKQSDNVIV